MQKNHLEEDDRIVNDEEIDTNLINSDDVVQSEGTSMSRTYRPNDLKKWRTVPPVAENYGQPGELGKPVKIPAYQQELMKEKFKENQFNLLASDMIWFNRSLTDVRHEA